jgi:hypothetical protein
VIGTKCESNNETFYNQIDFATSFSILKGLPLPKSSFGSAIPELLFDLKASQKLDVFKLINQRLLKMHAHDKSEGKTQFNHTINLLVTSTLTFLFFSLKNFISSMKKQSHIITLSRPIKTIKMLIGWHSQTIWSRLEKYRRKLLKNRLK